jgi:type IV pilus assembly protein PilW
MISLVIGLVVVGAVLVSFLGSGQTGRVQAAYGQMNEDAQIALNIMARDIQLAGYAQPVGSVTDPITNVTTLTKTFSGRSVFGCDAGSFKPNAAALNAPCNYVGAGAVAAPVLEVAYEADISNTSPTGAGVPTDCLGTGLVQQTVGVLNFYVTHNRYYVDIGGSGQPELRCASDVSAGQALVDNIESMSVSYGEANAALPRQIVRYVTASNVTDFDHVLAVRICLVVRSAEAVLPPGETMSYVTCNGGTQAVADRRLRRAYFTTATLRSKMPL